ncbi:MAG: signal peptidase I [Verrucomicrobiota bacterium]|nr:signal peptidase I [Verrucomicrobiota bacterium]MCC6820709.1 signal peptidase I [Limisphaerales bacterium]
MVLKQNVMEDTGSPANTAASAPPPAPRDYASLGRNLIKQLGQCLVAAMVGYGCFQFSSHYFFQTVQVDGRSMAPTLADTDRYLLNRWIYHVREPGQADVVVLRDPVDNAYLVKRIVAKPGDMVHMKDGRIFVNGRVLKEAYLPRGTMTFGDPHYREQLWICGRNQYFVLGDNRNNSADSRIYGAVPRQNILGLVVL